MDKAVTKAYESLPFRDKLLVDNTILILYLKDQTIKAFEMQEKKKDETRDTGTIS